MRKGYGRLVAMLARNIKGLRFIASKGAVFRRPLTSIWAHSLLQALTIGIKAAIFAEFDG